MFENSESPEPIRGRGEYFGHPYTTEAKVEKRKSLFRNTLLPKLEGEYKKQNIDVPKWFLDYKINLLWEKRDLLEEIEKVGSMNKSKLEKYLGGDISDLPYEVMDALLVDGSDDEKVAEILRNKRELFLKAHPVENFPELYRGVPGADEGIITFNGRFINKRLWNTATDSEKRSAMVGSTCFHYESGTPGMDDSPDDRF